LVPVLLLAGCSGSAPDGDGDDVTPTETGVTIGNPTAEQWFSDYPNSDFIVIDSLVCEGQPDDSWQADVVKNADLDKASPVGTVTRTGVTAAFQNWDATTAAVGTEISLVPASGRVYVANPKTEPIPYYCMIEG
jgi:hypothetical protein